MSRLDELRQAVREFVPVGGLLAWRVKISLIEEVSPPTVRITADVPDVATGRQRQTAYHSPVTASMLESAADWQEPPASARAILRKLIHEFVVHEADEGMGFRPDTRPASATFSHEAIRSTSPMVAEVERPFDPHAR